MPRSPKQEERIPPSLPPKKAIELLRKQLNSMDPLFVSRYDYPQVAKWENFTRQVIAKAFGDPHDNLDEFNSAGKNIMYSEDEETQDAFIEGLKEKKALLEGFVEQLEAFDPSSSASGSPVTRSASNRVFIVHGRDERSASELARIVERLGLEAVILHEKPNKGRTLIEKLESHAEVGYCFVLMTPDDEGRLRGMSDPLQPRARQNVVFEFGLFVGLLRRDRVCCLLSGNVDMPTDLGGLAQHRFNESVNEKRVEIVQELQAAGYEVNANSLSRT